MKKKCSVKGCCNVHCAKGYCTKHYQRSKKRDDVTTLDEPRHYMEGTSEYHAWEAMKDRCSNPNNKSYGRYGGRGIKVCDEWTSSFLSFFNCLGKRPGKGYHLDRIDNEGNYEPNNCRWTTAAESSRNRSSVKLNWDLVGKIRASREKGYVLAERFGVSAATISQVRHNKIWI